MATPTHTPEGRGFQTSLNYFHHGNNYWSQGTITDILEENVVQPLLVSTSAFTLATECVCMILKIVRRQRPSFAQWLRRH
eukprot:COSAG04_NODE_4148_length_2268_cov_2.035912_1_plen_80_part_00